MAPPMPPKPKLVWRVLFTDNLAMPQQRATALVNDCANMMEALDAASTSDTFKTFQHMFPHAVIAGCEFFGYLE